LQGVEAVEAVLDATPQTPTPMIAINENKIVRANLKDAVQAAHEVAKAIEAKDFDHAMALRDADFAEYHQAYMTTTATDQPALRLPKEKVGPFDRDYS
jgi:6-phosphofructokinase 1